MSAPGTTSTSGGSTSGGSKSGGSKSGAADAAPNARRVAIEALVRIDRDGAYANLLLPKLLARSGLEERDRAFVTQLVYGTTRHRRACDWFVDRFALGDLDPQVRAALQLGTYQLRMLGTPPHAAVSATVDAVPRKVRGLVNAVLRKVASAEDAWPSEAVRLSYPDWVLARLTADLGHDDAVAALEAMNEAAATVARDDGYVQDPASQWVVDAVGVQPGERVLDLCAAPGGKATAMASCAGATGTSGGADRSAGPFVVAADQRPSRVGLIADNARRLELPAHRLAPIVADGTAPPFAPSTFDRVLVDAPCSGLGSLRRRADARWRLDDAAPERLAALQAALLAAAAPLVRPGGTLAYSVCTLTAAETTGVADAFAIAHPGWTPVPIAGARAWGSGALLLPQDRGTDGMAVFAWVRPPDVGPGDALDLADAPDLGDDDGDDDA